MARRAVKTGHPADVRALLIVALNAIFDFGLDGMERGKVAR